MFLCDSVEALGPQTGIYWSPDRSGWAFYVENQAGTIFVAAYAYSPVDGEPEFYVASGPMTLITETDAIILAGVQPLQGFVGDLFRVPAGPCLACVYSPYAPAQSVGRIQLIFYGRGGVLTSIRFTDGTRFPNPFVSDGLLLRRFNFALGGVNANPGDRAPLFDDMRGEWVFTDQSDPARSAWRFHFTEREDGADLSEFELQSSVAFRDPSRNAVMYCFAPAVRGLPPAQIQSLPAPSCELRQNGQTLFWTSAEYAIDEFIGSLGSAPARSTGIYRGPQRVIGRKISD